MPALIAQYVGIDISKATLDVAAHPGGDTCQFSNDKRGHKALCCWLKRFELALITFESTGVYHRAVERYLAQQDLPFAQVDAYKARQFARASGQLAKTDRVDAQILARFGALMKPVGRALRSEAVETLNELESARRGLVKDRTAQISRLKVLTQPVLIKLARQRLVQIKAQIKTIEQACHRLIAKDDTLRARFDILVSIKGIGKVSAIALLSDMPELGTMDKRQTAALAGLAPMSRQSGSWVGKSYIARGRAKLRCALYMPALVAIRFNSELRAQHMKLVEAGKPFKVAIVAIMRRLLITANALLRDNRKWNEINA